MPCPHAGKRERPSLVDFELLQTGHGMHEVIVPVRRQIRAAWNTPPAVPVIDGEPAYENLNGQIPADVCRSLFWVCMTNGARATPTGPTASGRSTARQPYGPSPAGNNWGTIPWPDAMKLPGSEPVAFGKKLLTQYEWWQFEPHAQWAIFANETSLAPALTASGLGHPGRRADHLCAKERIDLDPHLGRRPISRRVFRSGDR